MISILSTVLILSSVLNPTLSNPLRQTNDHFVKRSMEKRTDSFVPISMPPLGKSCSYVVLAKTGISTIPDSVVNGDIGISPGPMTYLTGFSFTDAGPGPSTASQLVNNKAHAPESPEAAGVVTSPQAVSDMMGAYTYAANQPASSDAGGLASVQAPYALTYTAPFGGLIPSGTIFKQGSYRWASTVVIPVGADIYLDGNCGDVFIFYASGAISTGANSKIHLMGTLTSASVFWVTATVLTTGVGSTINGNILTGTNAVVGTNGVLNGLAQIQTQIALQKATINKPSFAANTCKALCQVQVALSTTPSPPTDAGPPAVPALPICINGTQFMSQGSTTCQNCAATTGVATCSMNGGTPLTCTSGYGLNVDNPSYPYCQIICAPGSGNNNNDDICRPCSPGYYNSRRNTCSQVPNFTWAPGNTVSYTACIFDSSTMQYESCDSTNGNPSICKYYSYGLSKTALPSPKVCVPCLYGSASKLFANDCQCQADYTPTLPCKNGVEPQSFTTGRIYVTENNNGCQKNLGWLSLPKVAGYGGGSFFAFSLNETDALNFYAPDSLTGTITAIKSVTAFKYELSYLGIQFGGGQLGIPFSDYKLNEIYGDVTGASFVAPGTVFGEVGIANGIKDFGDIGRSATSDCWIVNPYSSCRGGYPLTTSIRIPASKDFGPFTSTNASFVTNGLLSLTPIDSTNYVRLGGTGNTGEVLLTLIPN